MCIRDRFDYCRAGLRTDKQRGLRRLAAVTNRRQHFEAVSENQCRRPGGHQLLDLIAQAIRRNAVGPGVLGSADYLKPFRVNQVEVTDHVGAVVALLPELDLSVHALSLIHI